MQNVASTTRKGNPLSPELKAAGFTAAEFRRLEQSHRESESRLQQLERELDPDSDEYLRRICGVLPTPAWVLEAWSEMNATYFAGKLRSITIERRCRPEWTDREIGYDGAYMPLRGGRITIADHVFRRGAGAVLGILLHEMVHQYVHEVGSDEREMHGPEFRHMGGWLSRMLGVLPPAIGNEGAWPYASIDLPGFAPDLEELAA